MLFAVNSQVNSITLFLCGDVMTGRGIDQCLPFPSPPQLYEPWAHDARIYVQLAEKKNGSIKKHQAFTHLWGVALDFLNQSQPDYRLINLETSITDSEDVWTEKEVHYRMNPKNIPLLEALQVDCCSLANNHILDWGEKGLLDTLNYLAKARITSVGAGRNLEEAQCPGVFPKKQGGRVLIFAMGLQSSGIPETWAASAKRPGIHLLKVLSHNELKGLIELVQHYRRPDDLIVWSIHWGENWGYFVPPEQKMLSHHLIDSGAADLIHGHSAHHVKGFEVYRQKLILYGCGDFVTDYEGILNHQAYRGDLPVMFLPSLDAQTGCLMKLDIIPLKLKRFRLDKATDQENRWIRDVIQRESSKLI